MRQPPSSGESTLALNSEPRKKPSAMPAPIRPLASPNWRGGNHWLAVLKLFITITGSSPPCSTSNTVIVKKLSASPRAAPSRPASSELATSTRLGPRRSPIAPPTRLKIIPGSAPMPHTMPTCTTFRPRSSEISFDSTDTAMVGMVTLNMVVKTISPKRSQR